MNRFGYLLPVAFLCAVPVGYYLGGAWNFLTPALAYVVLPMLDLVLGNDERNPRPEEEQRLLQDRFYDAALYVYAALHFPLLVWAAAVFAGGDMGFPAAIGFVWSVALITGGIGITVAHELGHRLDRLPRWVSRLLLASVCYGHFQIEHNKGHHSRVATPHDPATARFGESFYAFWPRTVIGGWLSAWRIEQQRLNRRGHDAWSWHNQMWWVIALPLLMALSLGVLFGPVAVLFFLLQSVVAFTLLELVNYVEHYGLERRRLPDGAYEKISAAHSWNATQRASNWLLFNLERHSHHHVHQSRPYQVLRHMRDAPQLPMGYAALMPFVLVPPLWRALMDRRTRAWRQSRGLPAT